MVDRINQFWVDESFLSGTARKGGGEEAHYWVFLDYQNRTKIIVLEKINALFYFGINQSISNQIFTLVF